MRGKPDPLEEVDERLEGEGEEEREEEGDEEDLAGPEEPDDRRRREDDEGARTENARRRRARARREGPGARRVRCFRGVHGDVSVTPPWRAGSDSRLRGT